MSKAKKVLTFTVTPARLGNTDPFFSFVQELRTKHFQPSPIRLRLKIVVRPVETWAYISYSLWSNGGLFSSPATVTGCVILGLCPHVFLHSEDMAKEEDQGGRAVWVWLQTWGVWEVLL